MSLALDTRNRLSAAPTERLEVIVHCGPLTGPRLERRIREVLRSVPEGGAVVVTVTAHPGHLTPAVRRAKVIQVHDGGAQLIQDSLLGDAPVVVVPMTAQLLPGWWEEVRVRLDAQPDVVGVVPVGENHLFAFPSGVRNMDAPRAAWSAPMNVHWRQPKGSAGVFNRSLGAVLIVKDEEAALPACLAALKPLVDEVVVYDTGSSDDTRSIARGAGAVVVDGYWDDDFGAARNRAMAHATCDWVLSVDADEVVEADRAQLRAWLDRADGSIALVDVVSPRWVGGNEGYASRSSRIFARSRAAWRGALHEQVVDTNGDQLDACSSMPPVKLHHSGYQDVETLARSKADRNVRISKAALDRLSSDDPRWGDACIDYARSLAAAGRGEDCAMMMDSAAKRTMSPPNALQAARTVVPRLIALGRCDDAQAWIDRARGASEAEGQLVVWDAELLARRGDVQAALETLSTFEETNQGGGVDIWGQPFAMTTLHVARASILLADGDPHRARAQMLAVLQQAPDTVPLVLLMQSVLMSGLTFENLAEQAPMQFVRRAAREIFTACPDVALEWLRACRNTYPQEPVVVVAGSLAAARTGIAEALDWAMHAREAGIDTCALTTMVGDADLPNSARIAASSLLLHGFLEESVRPALVRLVADADPDAQAEALSTLRAVIPDATSLLTLA